MPAGSLSDFSLDVFIALLQGYAVNHGLDPALANFLKPLASLAGQELKKALEAAQQTNQLSAQLLQAGAAAQECFESRCQEQGLRAALADLSPLTTQAFQQALLALRSAWSENDLQAALLASLRRDLSVLTPEQQLEAANLYLDCIRRALLPIEEIGSIIHGLAALRIDARTARIEAKINQLLERMDELARQPRPPTIPIELPAPPSRFRARRRELKHLLAHLRPGTIYTLCGPGGIGKTALASKALHSLTDGRTPPPAFPGGVITHSFYKQSGLDLALAHIARACGEELQPNPPEAARRALAGRVALLVLDGAEEAENLQALLEIRQRCGVLITSRDPAHLYDAGQTLTPLSTRDSLALLNSWAEGYAQDAAAARQVCEFVGYLPLALRIAGKYLFTSKTPVQEYVNLLENSALAQTLELEKRRHESIPILLDYSVARLSDPARAALAVVGRLAFASFEREPIAAALSCSDPDAVHALAELVRYGMLDRTDALYVPVHRLLQRYAHGLPLPPAALENLAVHFIQLAEEQTRRGPAGHAALDAVLAHILTVLRALRAGAEWGALIGLAAAVDDYLDLHGRAVEHLQVCELALEAARASEDRWQEGKWLTYLGLASWSLARAREAIERYQQALAIAREIGDRRGEGADLGNLGNAYAALGEPQRAIEFYQQALAIAREIGDRRGEGVHLGNLGSAYFSLGEPRRAIEFHEQALAIAREIGDRRGEGAHLGSIGMTYYFLEQYEQSSTYLEEGLAISRQVGDRQQEASWLGALGNLYMDLGQSERAIACLDQAIEIAHEIGSRYNEYTWLNIIGLAYRDLGQIDSAYRAIKKGLLLARQIGEKFLVDNALRALGSLGDSFYELGKWEQVLECNSAFIELNPESAVDYRNRAEAWIELGDLDRAEADCSRAESLAPDHPFTHARRGQLHYARGEHPAAIERYRKAASLNPGDATEFNFDLGLPLLCTGQADEALALIRERLAAHPRPSDLHSMLAEYESLAQRQPNLPGLSEALGLLRQAASSPPEDE